MNRNKAKLEALKKRMLKLEKAERQRIIIDKIKTAAQMKKNGEEAIQTILYLIDKRMTVKEKSACYDALENLLVEVKIHR